MPRREATLEFDFRMKWLLHYDERFERDGTLWMTRPSPAGVQISAVLHPDRETVVVDPPVKSIEEFEEALDRYAPLPFDLVWAHVRSAGPRATRIQKGHLRTPTGQWGSRYEYELRGPWDPVWITRKFSMGKEGSAERILRVVGKKYLRANEYLARILVGLEPEQIVPNSPVRTKGAVR